MATKQGTDIDNLDELFERFRQAPDSHVFVPLADACRKIDRIEEALEICDKGLERHPAYASGHVVKGKCLYDIGNFEAARDTFAHVLTLDASNLVALKFLGKIEADMGNTAEARDHLEHILVLDPDNKEIQKILRLITEEDDVSTTRAASTFDPHDDEDASDGETSDILATATLADIFAEQGYRDKAIKMYEEVLRADPRNKVIARKLEALGGRKVEESTPPKPEPKVADVEADAPKATLSRKPEPKAKPERVAKPEPKLKPLVSEADTADRPSPPAPAQPEAGRDVIHLGADDDATDAVLEREVDDLLADVDDDVEGFSEMRDDTPPPIPPERKKPAPSAKQEAKTPQKPVEKTATPADDAKAGDRRPIDERGNLKHFRKWLQNSRD